MMYFNLSTEAKELIIIIMVIILIIIIMITIKIIIIKIIIVIIITANHPKHPKLFSTNRNLP